MTLKQLIDSLTEGQIVHYGSSWRDEFIFLNKHSVLFYLQFGRNFVKSEHDISKIFQEMAGNFRYYKAIERAEAAEIMKQWFIEATKGDEQNG